MTVRTHCDFIVLFSTRKPGCQQHELISHSVPLPGHWANCSCLILIMPCTWLGSNKYQFIKSLFWLDQVSNPRRSDSPISQNGRQTLYSFDHPVWSDGLVGCLGSGGQINTAHVEGWKFEFQWVKLMTYKMVSCCFIAWRLVLLGKGMDRLIPCQNFVTEWDIGT